MPDEFDIQWNGDRLLDALSEPFQQANETLGNAFQEEITASKWAWPSDPSPRDIVDTGELRRSYAGDRDGKFAHIHSWNVDYALAVHEGARFRNGGSMSGRPWTKEPLEEGVLEKNFEKLAKSALGRVQ